MSKLRPQEGKGFLQVTQNKTGTKSGSLKFKLYQENI